MRTVILECFFFSSEHPERHGIRKTQDRESVPKCRGMSFEGVFDSSNTVERSHRSVLHQNIVRANLEGSDDEGDVRTL